MLYAIVSLCHNTIIPRCMYPAALYPDVSLYTSHPRYVTLPRGFAD